MKPYRILSLDGGGVYGYLSLLLLKKLVDEVPDVLEKVDFVAGTSVGSLIAAAIADGRHVEDSLDKFINLTKNVFQKEIKRTITSTIGMSAIYDNDGLKQILIDTFGDKKLKDLQKKILITSFKLYNKKDENPNWKAKIFHNFDGPTGDLDELVSDCIMASASVPIMFPVYGHYIDGALVSSNPAMCALMQLKDKRIKIENRPMMSQVKLLSIGRNMMNAFVKEENCDWGYLKWLMPLIEIILGKDGPIVDYQCKGLLGSNYHRIEPLIPTNKSISIDDFNNMKMLNSIADCFDIKPTVNWIKEQWY